MVGDEEGVAEELLNVMNAMEAVVLLEVTRNGSKRRPGWWQWRRRLGLPIEMMPRYLWWRLSVAVARVSAVRGRRLAELGLGMEAGLRWWIGGAKAAIEVFLGEVVPAVQVEQRGGGFGSGGAQLEDGCERKRHGGHGRGHAELRELGKMVEGSTGWTLYAWDAGIVLGASRFEAGGKATMSALMARLGVSLCGEVGEVGDDRVPCMSGRGGKARGRWQRGEQREEVVAMAVVGQGRKKVLIGGLHLLVA
uniref:DUF834 domain-containing protein n=1 Tax=Oryza punctata TaxID=4537 RepID=A0A0E0KIL9_ORYPU